MTTGNALIMKSRHMRMFAILACAVAAMTAVPFAASAETWYLKTNDNVGNLTTPSHWTNAVGTAATAFNADDVYVVLDNTLRASGLTDFGGGELKIQKRLVNLYTGTLNFNLLTLVEATIAMQRADGAESIINGLIDTSGSCTMRWLYQREAMTFGGKLRGDSSTVLLTDVRYAGTANHRNERFILAGDCSEYAGTIKVQPGRNVSGHTIDESEYYVKLVLATAGFTMPGAITVEDRCALEVTATGASVGSLTLKSGSILVAPSSSAGGLAVSDTLALTPPIRLRVVDVPSDGLAHTLDVLTAPAGTEIDPADFALEGDPELMQFAPTVGVRTANGRKTLTISYAEPIVELTTSDSSSLGRASSDGLSSIAWGLGSSWSNGQTPAAGTNCLVRMQNGNAMYLRTPTRNVHITFPGKSLTIATNCFLRVFQSGSNFYVDDLRLMGGSALDVGQSTYTHIYGAIRIGAGEVRFGTCNQSCAFYAPFSGSGDIWFSGPQSGTSVPQGSFGLHVDNPNFKGRMRVEYCKDNATYGARRETLIVDSELQLGGRLDAFDPKALTLRKYGRLYVRDSFALTRDYNRGVFVDGPQGGLVDVAAADHVLTFNTQLTLNGKLYKDGAGTLVMGGNVKFGAEASDMPTEGSNLFDVTNGTVKVMAADAMNGLATTFASGTRLVLVVDPTDADLMRYGIRNVKTATPFAVVSGGTLPFSLEASAAVRAAMKRRAVTIGLFTVTSEADAAFQPLLPSHIASPFPSSKGTVVRSEEDGVVTYSLSVEPLGMQILFR